MKKVYLLFALLFVATAATTTTSASARPAEEAPSACPPPVYECCDGAVGSARFCAGHGGTCAIITICGAPV
jgi:hypothetical protein